MTSDSHVLAVGGLQDVSTIQQELPYMEKYDIKNNQWQVCKAPSLPFPVDSSSYKAVGFGKEIIFIKDTAHAGQNVLGPSVVSFSEENGERKFMTLAPVLVQCSGYCCAVTNGNLYVIGGSGLEIDHQAPLGENTVQRYNRAKGMY